MLAKKAKKSKLVESQVTADESIDRITPQYRHIKELAKLKNEGGS